MELDQSKYLYFFILIPILLGVFLYNQVWKIKKQKEFGDINSINLLAPERSFSKSILKLVITLLGITALIIGLANPKMGTKMETVKREGIDIVFAMDVSKSMLAEDVAPNRLEKSKRLVSQIITTLGNDRIGIVAYAGSAFPVLPITTDYSVAKMFLQSMSPDMVSSKGTSLDEAIKLSATYFDDKSKTSKLLILISDGEDHSDGANDAAEEAKKEGMKIITIGIGTEKGATIPLKENGVVKGYQHDKEGTVVISKRNPGSLETIATTTGGTYIDGNNTKEVQEKIQKALENIQKTEFEATQMANFESQFQWFLAFAFLLLIIDLFLFDKKTDWIKRLNLFNEK
jgi:Ca-activated chloride channel homolog